MLELSKNNLFPATGYSEDVRLYQDFAARLYFMEEVNADDNA